MAKSQVRKEKITNDAGVIVGIKWVYPEEWNKEPTVFDFTQVQPEHMPYHMFQSFSHCVGDAAARAREIVKEAGGSYEDVYVAQIEAKGAAFVEGKFVLAGAGGNSGVQSSDLTAALAEVMGTPEADIISAMQAHIDSLTEQHANDDDDGKELKKQINAYRNGFRKDDAVKAVLTRIAADRAAAKAAQEADPDKPAVSLADRLAGAS